MAEIQRNLASYIDDLTEKKIISKLNDRKTVPLILLKNVDAKIKIFVLQSILRDLAFISSVVKVRRNTEAGHGIEKDEAAQY